MRTALIVVALVACLGMAAADCPHACSGHGTCGPKDECTCYPNYQAADCSERTCPFGLSFVDTPQGDLNHDGAVTGVTSSVQWSVMDTWEKFPNVGDNYNARAQEGHFYVECSNKGNCDRESGSCACFEGYEGSSCQRTTCPNDCSGHGVCRTVGEIAAGGLNVKLTERSHHYSTWTGVTSAFTYNLWDGDKNQGCVCDPGYNGYDCSLRECPRGDDPMTHRAKDCAGYACANERQILTINFGEDAGAATAAVVADTPFFMALNFTDWTGKVWSTNQVAVNRPDETAVTFDKTITSAAESSAVWKAELEAIPNGVFENVRVETSYASNVYLVTFTFYDNSGDLPLLVVRPFPYTEPASGSLDLLPTTSVAQHRQGNKEEAVCSNRGICDYDSGICKCFKGYYDDDCSVQHALAL